MKIRIKEPWVEAYQQFGWSKGIWGIGIDNKKVNEAIRNKEKLEIHIDSTKSDYIISPAAVKSFALRERCIYIVGQNTSLYVVPQFKLLKV